MAAPAGMRATMGSSTSGSDPWRSFWTRASCTWARSARAFSRDSTDERRSARLPFQRVYSYLARVAGYFANIREAVTSIFEGMSVTFSHFVRRPYTVQYPDRVPIRIQDTLPF